GITGSEVGRQAAAIVELERIMLEDDDITIDRSDWLRIFDAEKSHQQRLGIAWPDGHRACVVRGPALVQNQITRTAIDHPQPVAGRPQASIDIDAQAVGIGVDS
ncbi:MAG: hypothetical protein ACK56I_31475, partial [bacterium]